MCGTIDAEKSARIMKKIVQIHNRTEHAKSYLFLVVREDLLGTSYSTSQPATIKESICVYPKHLQQVSQGMIGSRQPTTTIPLRFRHRAAYLPWYRCFSTCPTNPDHREIVFFIRLNDNPKRGRVRLQPL